MVAPKAHTQRWHDRLIGIALYCPECPPILGSLLRVEQREDFTHPRMTVPDLVEHAGPLGFVTRCDACGFRVEMHGDRLPTVAMLVAEAAVTRAAETREIEGSPYGSVGPASDADIPSLKEGGK